MADRSKMISIPKLKVVASRTPVTPFRRVMLKKKSNDDSPEPEPDRPSATPAEEPLSHRYKILSVISEGGMGTICHAWDTFLKMDVALKLLNPDIAKDQAAITQLQMEAAMTMKLSHENIVRLHNIEQEQGRIFIVMEYVKGETLRSISQRMGPLSFAAVLDIAQACCSALTYAHRQGVLHRDIKPDNLMINVAMKLKLLDFGIAIKSARGDDRSEYLEGTPGYMSPEQLHGHPLDARTDVFSLSVVLCELLTGVRPFPLVENPQHMYDAGPQGIENLPPRVTEVLLKGMATDVTQRFSSAADLYNALAKVLQ